MSMSDGAMDYCLRLRQAVWLARAEVRIGYGKEMTGKLGDGVETQDFLLPFNGLAALTLNGLIRLWELRWVLMIADAVASHRTRSSGVILSCHLPSKGVCLSLSNHMLLRSTREIPREPMYFFCGLIFERFTGFVNFHLGANLPFVVMSTHNKPLEWTPGAWL